MLLPRRHLLKLLAAGSAATTLAAAGCLRQGPGGGSAGDGPAGDGPGGDGPAGGTEINFWSLDLAPKFNDTIEAVIAAWEGQHPGMSVRWTDVPWAQVERKLLAAVFARTAPDLVNLNPPFAANLASKEGLLDLEPLLPPGAPQSYLPAIWQAGSQQGHQFAIPWYLTVRISMANRRLLQQAGCEAPPRHWRQLPAFAELIKRRTGRYALFVTAVPDDSAELLEILVQMGVQLLDERRRAAFDSPAGRQAFGFWSDLYRRGLLPQEVVSQGYRRAIELYQSGDLALVATGPDFLRNLQTNAPGIAAVTEPHPPITGDSGLCRGVSNVAVMNLVVPRQSAVAAAAVDFGLFLTNAAHQLAFAEQARVLPSSSSALGQLQRQLDREALSPGAEGLVHRARLLSAQTLARAQVLVPAMPGVKRLQAIVYTQLQRAMLGQVSSDRALATAAAEWNLYAKARWP
jgi:putative chitobiose transport system substrate-binding protein